MKSTINSLIALMLASIFLYSCTKSTESVAPADTTNGLHVYGLNAMQPSDWINVPVFSSSIFNRGAQINGLTYSGTLPGSYLLITPQVRDQGQIGSCTGFCGAETDEILYYYQNNAVSQIAGLTTSTIAPIATQNQIANTSDVSQSGGASNIGPAAFSPLFLYFVERVVINHKSIGSDPGANMVNICQTLQGLSNNTGTGTALTYNSYTFNSISNETYYTYPYVLGSGGYNVATRSTYPYQTYPYNFYNYNSFTIPTPNYPIGIQNGTTNSSGTTTKGYYVITSTKGQLVTDVQTAIANNKPVMMGFNVYDKTSSYAYFERLNTTNYTYNPLNPSGGLISGLRLLGGHAVPIVGYVNDTSQPGKGVFICENSWGTPWGYHGYFLLPYSVIQSTSIVPSGSLYVAIL